MVDLYFLNQGETAVNIKSSHASTLRAEIEKGAIVPCIGVYDTFSASIAARHFDTLKRPLVFNQIAGGKSPAISLGELQRYGVGLVNYSTPCLFAAQAAVEEAMTALKFGDGRLTGPALTRIGLSDCSQLLHENLKGRDGGGQWMVESEWLVAE